MTKQQKRRKPSTVSRDKAAMWPTVAQTPGTEQRWSATHTWEQPDWTIDDLVAALRRRGETDLVLLERAQDVGGTWRDNTYPGAACDIPSRLYSYSFATNPDWSHTYSGSAEILQYIDSMVESSGVAPHIRFEHIVTGLEYDADAGEWTIVLDGRERVRLGRLARRRRLRTRPHGRRGGGCGRRSGRRARSSRPRRPRRTARRGSAPAR